MWENCCCKVLCHLTILPCLVMRLYRGDCCCQEDHAESDIRSYFRINYHPIQVFEAIRPQLWCPGRPQCRQCTADPVVMYGHRPEIRRAWRETRYHVHEF